MTVTYHASRLRGCLKKWQARLLLVPLQCHCERSEAISTLEGDCFVASLLAMTEPDEFSDTLSGRMEATNMNSTRE
jgi:hypothetical protein